MKYFKEHKKFCICYLILIIVSLISIIFTFNNHYFYEDTIAKITNVKNEYVTTEIMDYGYKEDIYNQTITAKIKNGKYKGKTITLENQYYQGQTYSQKYHKNDEIFISLDTSKDKIRNIHIEGYKRDKYIIILLVSFILIIVLVGHLKGFLSIISLIINIIIFNTMVYLNVKNISLALLSLIGAIIFSSICLTLVSGKNKKTLSAVISSIVGVSITMLITMIVINITNYSGLRFENMELLTRPYEGIFISELILGGLGAIMDISISISSSLNELLEKDPKITSKQLIKSGYNIGRDIMSTMINVLFFTYICAVIPNLTILLRNGINLGSLISSYITLEMTRALIGAIGITITIPVSIYITVLIYKRRTNK
jgi:uncharacterized membrane protein